MNTENAKVTMPDALRALRINHAATRAANAAAIMALPMTTGPLRAEIRDERVVFTGGSHGDHSLDLLVTDADRAWAHWHGYCANSGVAVSVEMPTAPKAPVAAKSARKAPRRSQNRLSAAYVRRPLTREEAKCTDCSTCGATKYAGEMFWFTDFGNFCTKRCADDLRREMDTAEAENAD
jgi:hypothetical protein